MKLCLIIFTISLFAIMSVSADRVYLLQEDFNGNALNSSIWSPGSPYNLTGSCSPSNSGELQNYAINNISSVINVSNGFLTLRIINMSGECAGTTRNYTGGAINTRAKFGWNANRSNITTIEFKFRMNLTDNNASAIFPAFWTTTTNSTNYTWPPEIDWLEIKGEDCFMHGNVFNASGASQSIHSGCADYLNSWVTLKIEYNNTNIRGYVNNVSVYNFSNSAYMNYTVGIMDSILRINFAVYPRNGTTVREDLLPYRYLVDYVYVYMDSENPIVNYDLSFRGDAKITFLTDGKINLK